MKLIQSLAAAAAFGFATSAVMAQVTVTDPWARATIAQQSATGVFMQISSKEDARLVSGHTAIGHLEIHEMRMEKDIMRMREIPSLDLPAGQTVTLKPGGYHLMVTGLKNPLNEGEQVVIHLTVEKADKSKETVEVKVPVRKMTAAHGTGSHGAAHGGSASTSAHGSGHHGSH